MKCPIDEETLVLADRQGIEIDYCPRCRGVWLDRGELDKLIERAAERSDPAPPRRDREREREWDRDDDDDDERRRTHGSKPKKKSFLSEIFEMGG